MRIAVVTPYVDEPLDWLDRCCRSVEDQGVDATHILVADGVHRTPVATRSGIQHIALSQRHADYGDTPRAIGATSAAGQGMDAVAFLDADNWFHPDHLSRLVAAVEGTGAAVGRARRELRRLDGSLLAVDAGDGDHVDTSCLFLTAAAFGVISTLLVMPAGLHAVGDRVLWRQVREWQLPVAELAEPTVAYRTGFAGHYRAAGEEPPPGAGAAPAVARALRDLGPHLAGIPPANVVGGEGRSAAE